MTDEDLERKFSRVVRLEVSCARRAVEEVLGCEVTAEQTINYALKVLADNYHKERRRIED